MNKYKLKRCLRYHVRLRPFARRLFRNFELQPIDDDWDIARWDEDSGIELVNINTYHLARLAFDHIHHFSPDPARDARGLKHGFLQLNVQIFLKPIGLNIEPLPPSYFRLTHSWSGPKWQTESQ